MNSLEQEKAKVDQQNAAAAEVNKGSTWKYALSGIAMLLVLVGTLYYILKDVPAGQVLDTLRHAKPGYLLLAVLMMFIFEFCIALDIKWIIDATTRRGTDMGTAWNTAFIGFYFNNITPSATGGQPMEMFYLHRKGIHVSQSSVLFILLAIFYNISVFLFAIVSYVAMPQLMAERLGAMKWLLIIGYIVIVSMTLCLLIMILCPKILRVPVSLLVRWMNQKGPRMAQLSQKLDRFMQRYEEASGGFVRHKRIAWKLIVVNLIQVFSYYQVSYFACLALGASPSSFAEIFALQSNLYIASMSIPTPGMVGVMEAGFVQMFRNTLSPGAEVSAMLLTRIVNLYGFMILAGLISIVAFARVSRKKAAHVDADTQA